ncbi:Enhancer of polycomb-like protein 1 [Yamadazyma tenuis]|uniref:Enhancer of polycomb-like protein n=1 Tax=Candida tenuis (strain ATCC 10573 / BCRC 21748 / CBS 615 / JCM 9827 / NBRC 10315 / NRRL Y-1498 / VKM Y-70) TaxID=590646 RepID=G3BBG3_CANTC|nr:uncharacterized protein CANTEDRAFT_136121 [Yamadazyma tenuis ATCC 10573]EGV62183.1 hypothetical protein CANTEDRAFT_136121 [Yamadazyma tenuis ATCC 10573]WEJ93441.1 Enhancer of polycomb-like protein 1 [Yamadazyma tenuis]
MAVPQSKNSNSKSSSASGARFRQRKISVKQPLVIFKSKDLPAQDVANELEPSQIHHLNNSGASGQQRDINSIETGVDKNEEDEVHLQQVINAAQRALLSSKNDDSKKDVYIPTPDASRIWSDAHKYYNDHDFVEPDIYIKYSAQVEDTIGVDYNMDEEDEEFLQKKINAKDTKISELEFEMVISKFEKFIEEKQPYLSMDPSKILPYKELSSYIIEEVKSSSKGNPYVQMGTDLKYISSNTLKERLSKELNFEPFITSFDKNPKSDDKKNTPRAITKLLTLFGETIYNHWKQRKIERHGKSITPSLKYEDPNANEKDNDNDPYICFRRREFRQARKTRRADTIGIEKIRLLQKSLHRARDIMFNVSQREILKLEYFRSEAKVFKLRCEAKAAKRAADISVDDDYLFYPHKKKKIQRVKQEEEEERGRERERELAKIKREKKYGRDPRMADVNISAINGNLRPDGTSSSTQPYVKLPPSKIPDLDLVTVSLVLKEKNETIKKAVLDKLRKRKEQDKGYVNFTDDPFQPYFNISTNKKISSKELKHIPYSSIASADFHQMNTSNSLSNKLKHILEDGNKPLPGSKTFDGKSGELIPLKPFSHLQSLLSGYSSSSQKSYIATLLQNIESRSFNSYTNGYGNAEVEEETNETNVSDPVFRLRRRVGRFNRNFIDRRIVHPAKEYDPIDEFVNLSSQNDEANEDKSETDEDTSSHVSSLTENKNVVNVYSSTDDSIKRWKSHWLFDNESSKEYETNVDSPFSLDPSKLNSISDETQSIRFGSMLLSKSYELLRESVHQRQQAYIQQVRMRAALQQQQMRNNARQLQQQRAQLASANGESTGKASNVPTSQTSSSNASQVPVTNRAPSNIAS